MMNDDDSWHPYDEVAFVERALDLPRLLEKKSCFLLGPRRTGKTSFHPSFE